jgi:hypothetical protein
MIDKGLYIHSLEEAALKDFLESTFFSEEVMHNYINFDEKLRKPDLLGKTVRVSSKQFPKIHEIVSRVSREAGIAAPEVYIYEDFYYGVESKGAEKPWIEISAKTIMDFTEAELTFLIAREICGISLKHTYHETLIDEALQAAERGSFVLGADTMIKSLKAVMYRWSRVSSYSADCFGYIACRDLKACTSAILKLILNNSFLAENTDISEYIKQAECINALNDNVYNYTKMDERIPYGPFRIKNLIAYASSGRGIKAVLSN